MAEERVSRTPNQARAGTTPHIVRYILAISLILALVGMAIGIAIYFDNNRTVRGQEVATEAPPNRSGE